jgi:N-acetylmuramoyl-L-alanine amidase CwlA
MNLFKLFAVILYIGMIITEKLLPVPSQRRSGEAIEKVTYIVCHDTANDGATALQNVNYFIQSANGTDQASAHAFVDDQGVIIDLLLSEKAWHVRYNAGIAPNIAGNFANDHAIGVELCYSTKGVFSTLKAYQNYCTYIVSLMQEYKLDTTKLIQHAELDPTRRTDPINAFSTIGKTWAMFLEDISALINVNKNKMEETTPEVVPAEETVLSEDGATRVEMIKPNFTPAANSKYCMITGFKYDDITKCTNIAFTAFVTDENAVIHEDLSGTSVAEGDLILSQVMAYMQANDYGDYQIEVNIQ